METLKDDGQIRDFDKMDRKIYFEAQNAPYYGAWGAAQNGLNPEISPDVRESYLWGLILDLEKELCGELSEEYQEKLDQLESMLLDQYSSIADDRFVWGYRLGVRTILDAMSARADGHNG